MWPSRKGKEKGYLLGIGYPPAQVDSDLPPYVVSDEFKAERAWRQLLGRKGLPYKPYKLKNYLSNTVDHEEAYVDSLFRRIPSSASSSSSSSSSLFVFENNPPPPKEKEKRPLRVLSESDDEKYYDALYEEMHGRKRRQLDEESEKKLKLKKDKKYTSVNDIIYADEVSEKKRLNLLEKNKKMKQQAFKRGKRVTSCAATPLLNGKHNPTKNEVLGCRDRTITVYNPLNPIEKLHSRG